MSTVENSATGDAIRYMVCTNGKSICGKNRGLRPMTRQIGGYVSDNSLQQSSRDIVNISLQDVEHNISNGGAILEFREPF